MKTFNEIRSTINGLCEAFKLGNLIGYETKNHSVEGFKIAKFQTESGNYEYIFKIN